MRRKYQSSEPTSKLWHVYTLARIGQQYLPDHLFYMIRVARLRRLTRCGVKTKWKREIMTRHFGDLLKPRYLWLRGYNLNRSLRRLVGGQTQANTVLRQQRVAACFPP
jgi:hypothetical protein